MFTGLIQDVGVVEGVETTADGARIRVATRLAGELSSGDSIAVNGVCLTATEVDGDGFGADAMNETLAVTSLAPLRPGDRVNLEPALRASDRLGGHIVQGHVDATGEVLSIEADGFARRLRVELDEHLLRRVVERGSVTLDGVSLTVAALGEGWLEVSLIPETLERTNLGEAQPGRTLNVESDVIAKYVERLMSPSSRKESDS